MNKFDWLKIYDLEEDPSEEEIEAIVVDTPGQQKSFMIYQVIRATVQKIRVFKKDTSFFEPERIIQYIDALDIEPPKPTRTDSELFNQIVFNTNYNYYEFVISLRERLSKLSHGETKYTLKEIALIHVYNGKSITRENAKTIAEMNGYESGEKLYQNFTHYSSASNRKGDPGSKDMLNNQIKRIEKILTKLNTDGLARAKDELSILKQIKRNTY